MVSAIERRHCTAGGVACMALVAILVTQFHGSVALAQLPATLPLTTGGMGASASLTIDAVLDAALEHAPLARSDSSYRELADTHDALGRRLISGRPNWQANYIDDGLLDDVGLMELETGISVNLWRPGERADTELLGDEYNQQLVAWQDYLRLSVAGQVRVVLADLVQAETMLDLARRASGDAERLLDITASMESAGAAAQADVLQARTRLLQQRQSELQAQADLAIAERRYAILTGLSIKPDGAVNETQVANSLTPAHPTLKFLQSQVGIAAASVALSRHQANGRPNLRIGVRRERGDRREPYIDTLGVTFSVPIGSNPAADASVSVARSRQVEAEVRMLQTRRQLETRLRELEQELALAGELLTLGEDRVMISDQRYEMSLAAFEVGESDLTQVVLAQQQALQAQKDLATARLSRQRLISEYNQTMGVLP